MACQFGFVSSSRDQISLGGTCQIFNFKMFRLCIRLCKKKRGPNQFGDVELGYIIMRTKDMDKPKRWVKTFT